MKGTLCIIVRSFHIRHQTANILQLHVIDRMVIKDIHNP